MSELPWENKKVAEIMSSVEGEDSSANSNATGDGKSSTPPIPDILANAFADIPMEEAKIDVNGSFQDQAEFETPQIETPSFDNLPDLSALGGNPVIDQVSGNTDESPSADIPPFMKPQSSENGPDISVFPAPNNYESEVSPFAQPSNPIPSGTRDMAKKRSPPPLFEPVIESDEGPVDNSPPEINGPPVVFTPDTVQFPPMGGQAEEQPVQTSDPFTPPADSLESNPFDSVPDSALSADPFAPPVDSVESNPFDSVPDSAPSANPFAPSVDSVESNPFDSVPDSAPSANPFAPSVDSVGSNPFDSVPGSAPSNNPFDASVSEVALSGNPFGDPVSSDVTTPEQNGSALKGSVKLPIDVGSLKKNLKGVSGITKGFLKNLAKGKSLIERMEDMREDVGIAGPSKNNMELRSEISADVSPFDDDPFESSEVPADTNPFSVPLGKTGVDVAEPVNSFTENELEIKDIRQVTPVDDPIMEMKEEYLLDNDANGDNGIGDSVSNDFGESGADVVISSMDAEIPVLPENDVDMDDIVAMSDLPEYISDSDNLSLPKPEMLSVPEITDPVASDELSDMLSEKSEEVCAQGKTSLTSGLELSKKVLSKELKDIKNATDRKIEDLEDDVGELKGSLDNMNHQFSSIHAEIDDFSSKISEISESVASAVNSNEDILSQKYSQFDTLDNKVSQVESKVSDFESSISTLQSDNASMRSDLSRIEENISDLVGSYTALLAQFHESLQENESKLATLDDMSSKIDAFGPRVEVIEKLQEESRSTSKEFSRSMSTMVDNLGNVSSDFQEFRQESEKKNTAMLEKIDSLTEYMECELKKIGARSYKGFGQNVHLSNIVKNSSNMKLCMEWLEFLMELVGRNNLPDILSYYEELGWITEKVRMELLHYAEGIDFYMEKPDWKLTPDDHVKSIWFIESLAGLKVNKNRLSVIERDIEKVKKGSEIYGI